MNENMNKNVLKEKVIDYASKVFFYCIKRCNNRMAKLSSFNKSKSKSKSESFPKLKASMIHNLQLTY